MLKLPEHNREFKIIEANDLIENHSAPKRLLPYFIDSLFGVKTNSLCFDINILKEPLREFAWLFTRITR